MLATTLSSLLVFAVMSVGLGWPFAARLNLPAAEKILSAVIVSLLGGFGVAWGVYVFSWPVFVFWSLPALALFGLAWGRTALVAVWRDREARDLIVAQMIVTAWSVGWLALVVTYSGGGWTGDWFGHWQRTVFFLEHGPRDILFNGFDPLTSRPPLANLVTGALLAVTSRDFAHYQLALTWLGCLAFLPAALLARRGAGRPVTAVLAVLFMLSPLWVQNVTFAWTKLPAAFFTLAAVHYFLAAGEPGNRSAGLGCAATLAAALLTHYSAGPYAVVIAAGWLIRGWPRRKERAWWQETAFAATVGAAVLATWFAWSLRTYGAAGTLLTNTSVTDQAADRATQLANVALNLRDTVVPHFLRHVDYRFIAQTSAWGWWRDWFFLLYQVNLLFACGSLAWLVLGVALVRRGAALSPALRLGWGAAIAATVFLGIAAHGARDPWGLAHICLQPLVLAGLALLAAQWDGLGAGWRRVVVAGATLDGLLGIALQFGAQSFLLDQWLAPGRPAAATMASYSAIANLNLRAKLQNQWVFFGDGFVAQETLILVTLAAVLGLALWRTTRRPA
jgi:hypothetical protein